MKVISRLDQHVQDVPRRIRRIMTVSCTKLEEHLPALLCKFSCSQIVMKLLHHGIEDEAHLAFTHIVLGLGFHESMTSQNSKCFGLKFLAYSLNETLSNIFHNDGLEGKGDGSSRLYQGASLQR